MNMSTHYLWNVVINRCSNVNYKRSLGTSSTSVTFTIGYYIYGGSRGPNHGSAIDNVFGLEHHFGEINTDIQRSYLEWYSKKNLFTAQEYPTTGCTLCLVSVMISHAHTRYIVYAYNRFSCRLETNRRQRNQHQGSLSYSRNTYPSLLEEGLKSLKGRALDRRHSYIHSQANQSYKQTKKN